MSNSRACLMMRCAPRPRPGRKSSPKFPSWRINGKSWMRFCLKRLQSLKTRRRWLRDGQHSFTVCDQPMVWDMVHFDVQLLGGIVLHRGRIAEMATGEGKTLVATLPLYLNALSGRGAH